MSQFFRDKDYELGDNRSRSSKMNLNEMIHKIVSENNGSHETTMRLFIRLVELLPFELPVAFLQIKKVAHRFWLWNIGSKEDLERARVSCWEFLQENSLTYSLEDPFVCALRAVICLLYEEDPSGCQLEIIDFFTELLSRALGDTVEYGDKVAQILGGFVESS